MPLITSQGYQLTPNVAPIAQRIGQILQQKQQEQRQGEAIAKKEQAIKIKDESLRMALELNRIKQLPDNISKRTAIAKKSQEIIAEGGDPSRLTALLETTNPDELNMGLQKLSLEFGDAGKLYDRMLKATEPTAAKPAGLQEFEALTAGLPEEQKKEAALIKLGLSPRAVGSAIQTISEKNLAEEIGKTEATIAQRKKFGEMTGSSRAKMIDKGFEKITKIDLGIKNLDRALEAIDAGASTGVLQQYSPSIRASSIALDQVKNTLALDVLNSATFGALSEKELELTKETALPTKLSPTELRQWVVDRKAAEEKLKAYYQEQIDHLDQGGTVASFLRKKEREQMGQPTAPQVAPSVIPQAAPPQGGVKFLGFE